MRLLILLPLVPLCLVLGHQVASAQQQERAFEITGLAGYQVSPTFSATTVRGGSTRVDIADSVTYGVVLGRLLRPGVRPELSWRFQPTHLTSTPDFGPISSFDLDVHYFQAGASFEGGSKRVQGFGLLAFGATLAHPHGGFNDSWFLSFAVALGLKLRLTQLIGIRAESRLGVPVRFSSGGLWCANQGCAVASSGARAIAQIDFVAGPVLAF